MTVPDTLREALAERYTLERPIGQGGMATVYLAADRKHGRRVAVKILRPDLVATLGAARFLREIQIAARLQHPHILLLIDSGEAGGFLYYVMPFVDGESLRGRLEREGPLLPATALRIARQVGDALDYAHRHGVVHRDIKPENILLADGHAIVADFGVAKALSEATDKTITRTGYPVGTIGYMSPEQAAGFGDLTARSDVFSLACVVYEMLVGQVPGQWPSEDSVRMLRLLDAPGPHREVLEALPAGVEQALVRGLALRPEQRFAQPSELVDALEAAFEGRPRFSDTQVRSIVQRASELEVAAPTQTGALSLGGIQRIAADVGIPPEHVERAAREVARPVGAAPPAAPPKAGWFLGSPNRIVVERIVTGEVSDQEYATLVDEVRLVAGNVGQASTLGRSLSWQAVWSAGQVGREIGFSVNPANGQTRIRIEERLTPIAGGLFGGLMGGFGGVSIPLSIIMGAEVLHAPILIPVFLAAGIGGSWSVARGAFKSTHAKRLAELEGLADRLAGYIRESIEADQQLRLGPGRGRGSGRRPAS